MKGLTTVREAQISDGAALYRAWQTLRDYNASLDPRIRLMPVSQPEFVAGLELTIRRPTSKTFVAERDGALLGFGTCGVESGQPDRLPERHATVGYLFVDPGARRLGLGRRMFDAMVLWAKDQEGISHVEMPVLHHDSAAVAFWTALGFRPYIQRLWAPLDPAEDGE